MSERFGRRLSGYQEDVVDAVSQLFSPGVTPRAINTSDNVTTGRGSDFGLSTEDDGPVGTDILLSDLAQPRRTSDDDPQAPVSAANALQTLTLGGLTITVAETVGTAELSNVGKLYDKTTRYQLPPDQMTDFRVAATKCVLRKRLAQVSVSATDEGALEHVCNLNTQIQSLRDHLHLFDLDDVFQVVKPVNSRVTPQLHPKTWNVFEDYVSLDPAMVANSITYYHLWLYETPHIRENLSITYAFLKSNTDDSLWNKCLQDYEKYPEEARGGPLMLILILKRIQNTTESALANLVTRIQNLKISEIEGENVETVANLVKAALM